ncbi:LysR family transcriptional regulator [Chelativorans sp. YIM 93263]|uniref:LysR family transcriptional regulator n=1 Tax=Chelativorans sp. YIM 93263 TaxID=2906648 RepID=UPI0023795E4B|nr:LysR family transcriptional regulator [Chelativorans sp. YIM 93263]
MSRNETNRLREIEVFVQVVEAQGFSAAARRLRMTPSAVSKLISRLEERLGVPLIRRSTRRLRVTAEGASFYESGTRILSEVAAAEREVAAGAAPRGRLRVNSNVPFGHHWLIPLLPKFQALYPELTVDLVLTDHVVDLIEERADLAIRTGPLKTPNLIARKLIKSRMTVVAAPSYIQTYGTPRSPAELERHKLLGFCFSRINAGWPFLGKPEQPIVVHPSGGSLISDGESMRLAALAGAGIARLSDWHLRADIEAGRLIPLLEEYNPGDDEIFYAVYVGQGRYLPARVRAFLDFLVANVKEN